MPSTRKVLRAFLASPGDLQEERRVVRDVVVEFNDSWADTLGYQIELVGWEETVAGFGRPQHLINQDVDRCDLFIGMIWKRWGTPPDTGSTFSSGFQEEFERSIDRREQSGSPDIALFFKQIPDEFMVDPGDDLKRVLEFRETIIAEKKILFQKFSTVREMEALARKCITAYVNRIKAADTPSEPGEVRVKRAKSESEKVEVESKSPESSPLSAEGFAFLESLVNKMGQERAMDDLSASDVARFRLLANSLSKPGNEEMDLGVHDLNILFSARAKGMKLGEIETQCLTSLGFRHLSNENVPLWCWYSDLPDARFDAALVSSFLGATDDEKVGAISVLGSLAHELPTDNEPMTREWIAGVWFSEDSSARVRSAALGYLAKNGTAEDFAVAKKEYDRSDHETFRRALECMVGILLRTGQGKLAQQLILESQFESLDANTLQAVLEGFENMETAALLPGLEHRNAQVRLRTLKVLLGRGALNHGMAEQLSGDSDALIRNEAITALSKLGRSFTEEEVKEILVRPQKQRKSSLLGMSIAGYSDRKGEGFFERYQLDSLKNHPEAELTRRVKVSLMYDDAAYFARVEKYFAKHAKELRRDIDDTFNAHFEERIRRTETAFDQSSISKDLIKRMRDSEDLIRKNLTRQGLDILCSAGKREDLQRIRGNLQNGYTRVSEADAEYLGKHGEWADIPLLANVDAPNFGVPLLTLTDYGNFQDEVTKAVLSMGRAHPVSMLFSLEIPAFILKRTIELCAESRFSKISRDALLGILDHESADVRKAASIKAVRALSAKRIKSILHEYIGSDKYRYYNVIHWLDLGASMPRYEARKVAHEAVG